MLTIHGKREPGVLCLVEQAIRLQPALDFRDVHILKDSLLLVDGHCALKVNLSKRCAYRPREIVSFRVTHIPKKYQS